MADCRGSFNVATPVITSALTGDDSPSLFRGFTGSSSAREGPGEAGTQQGTPLSGARMSCKVKSADLRVVLYLSLPIFRYFASLCPRVCFFFTFSATLIT
ncbi:Uncharacterized protein DBV15_04438 [Temnothorax longispinosus]|uniref:Uncharacterized protein n=1 Tax=Temnothorax longispinosus TaxID=300112 RepID=A0A4S2KDB5_9HYME|nr:Uncharacterized protein DBV15_04438 [Temnothorax longispinosus]